MGMGTNLGNTLEAPDEGKWAPRATEADFDAFKAVNFTTVRVPVRWDTHTGTTPPYSIDETWMARVETVLGWSLARGFITIVNVHHDDWLDHQGNFDKMLPRFEAIWEQVSTRLKDKHQSLVFECFNEPHVMTTAQLNKMTDTCVRTIRKTNPTRVVMISGLQWDNPTWILSNPAAIRIPKDAQLMLHIHSYDPSDYTFSDHKVNTWGSASDRADLKKWAEGIQDWSEKNNLPVFYGEFGVTHSGQQNRLDWYTAHYEYISKFGWGASVWDDCGGFKVYDRKTKTWDTGVLKALGRVPPTSSAVVV
jgi:endoglucanase